MVVLSSLLGLEMRGDEGEFANVVTQMGRACRSLHETMTKASTDCTSDRRLGGSPGGIQQAHGYSSRRSRPARGAMGTRAPEDESFRGTVRSWSGVLEQPRVVLNRPSDRLPALHDIIPTIIIVHPSNWSAQMSSQEAVMHGLLNSHGTIVRGANRANSL